jgi:UDP-N-acetylmuramyl pentapeptide phosphotransferase/UDP-N-acetylglucosamine-1-phosphate transferase
MLDSKDPINVVIMSGSLASFAGLAELLRSGRELTWRAVASALLNSGLIGAAIGLVWWNKYDADPYFLIGVCVLAGLGGATFADFAIQLLKRVVESWAKKQ